MFASGVINTPWLSTKLFGTSNLDNLASMTLYFGTLFVYKRHDVIPENLPTIANPPVK